MAVYFIQDDGGEIKIGWSEGNPYRRLNAFRTGNPRELKLLVSIPGGREEEQALHERFADLRTRGEWFKPDARLLGFIEGMRYAHADKQPEPVDEDEEPTLLGFSVEQLEAIAGWIRSRELHERATEFRGMTSNIKPEQISDCTSEEAHVIVMEAWSITEQYKDEPFGAGVRFYESSYGAPQFPLDAKESAFGFITKAGQDVLDLYLSQYDYPVASSDEETH